MSPRVHLALGDGTTACNAGARWASTVISSVRNPMRVTCGTCQRTRHWRHHPTLDLAQVAR